MLKKEDIKKEILELSYKEQLGHIPSALSLVDLLLFLSSYFQEEDRIFIGKPYGAQAYEVVKDFFPLACFPKRIGSAVFGTTKYTIATDITLGHTLGMALGYAYVNPHKHIYVIMGDTSFFEGSNLEACTLINKLKIKNVTLLIDNNQFGVTEKNSDNTLIVPLLKSCGFLIDAFSNEQSSAFIFNSIKGEDIKFMKENSDWHYKTLSKHDYKLALMDLA